MPDPVVNKPDRLVEGRKCQRCGAAGHWVAGPTNQYVLCYSCAMQWCHRPIPKFQVYTFSPVKWEGELKAFIASGTF
jgi:hypothetical protein